MRSKKVKTICNTIVIGLGIISLIALLKFSNLPNYFNLKFMEKPEGDWSIIISILTSYIVTVGFYIVMNLIPEYLKEKDEEEHNFPYMCNMYTDVRRFILIILKFWGKVYFHAGKLDESIDIKDISNPMKMFDQTNILKAAMRIEIKTPIGEIRGDGKPILWAHELHAFLKIAMDRGERILMKYSKDIPSEIYRDIDYLIEESPLIGRMHSIYGNVFRKKAKNTILRDCIELKNGEDDELKETANCINNIYDWVNNQYDILNKKNKKYNVIIQKNNFVLFESNKK